MPLRTNGEEFDVLEKMNFLRFSGVTEKYDRQWELKKNPD
jgi:hypothetical protein